jgi:hypothetical protein
VPLQNRVDPWGRLHAVEARGAWMGNRGVLHDASKRIVRPWRVRAWILCRLQFKGRHRQVFAPQRYSELFFIDEATAFAAGHRPCAECNRERFNQFRNAWGVAVRAAEIDALLHAERIAGGEKRCYEARLDELPDGVMVERDGSAFLVRGGALYPWSFEGYGAPLRRPSGDARVRVLTPRSMVAAIARGLEPQVDESAEACRNG